MSDELLGSAAPYVYMMSLKKFTYEHLWKEVFASIYGKFN